MYPIKMIKQLLLFSVVFSLLAACLASSVQQDLQEEPGDQTPTQANSSDQFTFTANYQFAQISIPLPSWFAGQANTQELNASVDPSGFIYDDYPAHMRIDLLSSYTGRDPFAPFQPGWTPWGENPEIAPQIFIYQTKDANAIFSERIEALKTILDSEPLPAQGELPLLPTFNSSQVLRAQLAPLAFEGGRGLRFITHYSQEAAPIINPAVFYTFQGLTTDGSLYVAAFFPLYISILPDQIQVDDWDAFNRGYRDYVTELVSQLESLEPGDFAPDLEVLDAVIHSLSISTISPTTASPSVSTPESAIGPIVIGPENAGELTEVGKLGKGTILSHPFYAPEGMPIYSPDGRWMAVPTAAGIDIYAADTLEELHTIPVGTPFIAFSPDEGVLAASDHGAVSLWDPASGDRIGELKGDPGEIFWELAISPDGLLLSAVTANREIILWSLESGERLYAVPGDRWQFSPDGELGVAVVYGENRVYLYESRSGTELNKWNVRSAGFAPGGQIWLEDDGSVRLAYIDRDLLTAPFAGTNPSFSSDGSLMALYANRQISLYDHEKGKRAQILEGSYQQIDGVLFSPDGQTLAGTVFTLHCPTCSEWDGLDRYLVLWNAVDGAIITKLEYPELSWIGYSAEGRYLAALSMESVLVLDSTDGSVAGRIEGFTGPVAGMALAPDGKTLAAVHTTNPYTLRFWDLENSRVDRVLFGPKEGSYETDLELAFSPDGSYLAVRGDLWDLKAGERMTALEQAISDLTSFWPTGVAFEPQGDTLATGSFNGQLDLWNVSDGALLKRFGGYDSWVTDIAFSPDGNFLAAAYSVPDYLVQVWQLPEGTAAFILTGGYFTRITYSPDGRLLATIVAKQEYDITGGEGGFVQLWDVANGNELVRLEIDDAASVAFSPDGRILATGSIDGTLRLWETDGGRMLLEVCGHYEHIQRLAFTPDGTRLVSGSLDGTIAIWGIP